VLSLSYLKTQSDESFSKAELILIISPPLTQDARTSPIKDILILQFFKIAPDKNFKNWREKINKNLLIIFHKSLVSTRFAKKCMNISIKMYDKHYIYLGDETENRLASISPLTFSPSTQILNASLAMHVQRQFQPQKKVHSSGFEAKTEPIDNFSFFNDQTFNLQKLSNSHPTVQEMEEDDEEIEVA
jgi:hypothetical protein